VRSRLTGFAILLTGCLALALPVAALAQLSPQSPINTNLGPVTGTTTKDGVLTWLGIPYAAPPVGDLRWKAPQPPAAWVMPHAATQFAPSCMQPLRNHRIAYFVGDDPIAEDCLYLNVWAPKGTLATSRLPVIVFIHGGSFVAGSGRKPLYVGDRLAEKGAVVVSINYRLGQLGFLAHPELSAESPTHASGNYGFMDQVLALKWVKANIAAFGGDPSRITIMGQSAGAISLAALQLAPSARGLFARIAALSGSVYTSFESLRGEPLQNAERNGKAYQELLGAKTLDEMRQIPADQFIAKPGRLLTLVIDGDFLSESPAALYQGGKAADVPTLMGGVRDEGISGFMGIATLSRYRAALDKAYGDRAPAVLVLYPAADDASARIAAERLSHDLSFGEMMLRWADMQNRYGKAPVYAYVFDQVHPYSPGVSFSDLDPLHTGVNHTDDVAYWLGTFESFNLPRMTRNWTATDLVLGDTMQRYLVAFASTGDPNSAGGALRWPEYESRKRPIMRFSSTSRVDEWPDADRILKLGAIGPPKTD
jgi:para-nitrobenzyl esterase